MGRLFAVTNGLILLLAAGMAAQGAGFLVQAELLPTWGDAVPIHDDEIPVFWACGVTPQSVIMAVRPDFCITHYPGAMLVTDRRNSEFAIM